MEKSFDLEVVDALAANALRKTLGIERPDPADAPFRAEGLAAQILSKQGEEAETLGYDCSKHVSAGFRLAMRLCCRIMADPLRVHRGGVRRDVKTVLTWLDQWREDHDHERK